MRVLVTGGSGFVGRSLIPLLSARGHEVRALARSDAAAAIVERVGAVVVRGDLDDEAALRAAMSGCDAVVHAAASTKEWAPYEEFHRINVGGTERVLAAAVAAGIKRLVHVSTEAVLLDGRPLVQVDETRPLPEKPIGNYARTKNLAERRVRAANSPSLATIVVRPRMVWGRGDTTLLPKLVDAVEHGRFAWIDGGRALTSTCHVRNTCLGIALALERGHAGEVYFLTDGEPIAVRDFLTAMLKTQGKDAGTRSIPRWLAAAAATVMEGVWRLFGLRSPPPAQRTAVLLIGSEVTVRDDKARRELGYAPEVTRAAGLADMAG